MLVYDHMRKTMTSQGCLCLYSCIYLYVYMYHQEDGYTVHNSVLACTVGPWYMWVPRYLVIYTYRLTVLGAGAVFAYLIRHIQINPLNDSRFMAVFIPSALFFSVVGNLSDLLVFKFIGINTFSSLWGIFLFSGAVVLLSVLFIPTVLAVIYLYTIPEL